MENDKFLLSDLKKNATDLIGRSICLTACRLLLGLAFAMIAVLAVGTGADAADHLDGEAASADPAADITDVYAWMQNSDKINLILNVFPLASEGSRFSDSVQYVFRINSQGGYGDVNQENRLVCTFTPAQAVTCELEGVPLVSSVDASSSAGVTSNDGAFKIFAGLRNDPFFFDLDNFKKVRSAVVAAAPNLAFDDAGCPTLDQATKTVLVSSLTGAGGLPGTNSPPKDFFAALNVMSIVVQTDKSLFGPGPLYSVSASTHRIQ